MTIIVPIIYRNIFLRPAVNARVKAIIPVTMMINAIMDLSLYYYWVTRYGLIRIIARLHVYS